MTPTPKKIDVTPEPTVEPNWGFNRAQRRQGILGQPGISHMRFNRRMMRGKGLNATNLGRLAAASSITENQRQEDLKAACDRHLDVLQQEAENGSES